MLVNIICQDSGENLCTFELDFPRLTDEQVPVTQMAIGNQSIQAIWSERTRLHMNLGYTWCGEVKQQKDNAEFIDIDCDDPIVDGAVYRVVVMQKGQRPKNQKATDFEMVEMEKISGMCIGGTKQDMARQQSQSILPGFGSTSNSGQTSMTQSILLQFDLDSITPLNRMALGSNGEVGNLYDVKTDTLIGGLKFSNDSDLRDIDAIKVENVGKATCRIGDTDMESRFEQLGIDVQQKINVSAQMSEVSGYGLFVQPEDILIIDFGSAKKVYGFTIVQMLTTKKVSLNLRDPRVASIVFDQATTKGFDFATHILHSCTYGIAFCAVVTYDAEQSTKLNLERIHKIIHYYVKDDYKTTPDWNYLKSIENNFKLQLFADQQILNDIFGNEESQKGLTLTQLIEGIKIRSLKSLLTKDFHGHPLSYELFPLDQFIQPVLLNTENKVTNCDPTLLANNLLQIDTTMKDLAKAAEDYKRVNKQFSCFLEFDYCFAKNELNLMTEISNQLRDKFYDFDSNCRHFIKILRTNHFRHEEHAKTFEEVESSHEEFYRNLQALASAMDALDSTLIDGKKLKEMGVCYVGRLNTTLEDELQNAGNHCYVYFSSQQLENSFVQENIELFTKLFEQKQNCIYVNTELAGKPEDIPSGIRIVKYRNGKPEFTDYLNEHWRKLNTCIIRLQHGKEHTPTTELPEAFVALQIPCPKFMLLENSCPADDCYWECDGCGQLVRYDRSIKLDENPTEANAASLGYFYCGCGRAPANHFEFRCKNVKFHDEHFSEYTFSALSTLLKQYCKREDSVNILLLSETGCGKSTWINSLANYLTFESLEDAAQDGPKHVIPAMFMKGTQRITIGDVDETKQAGLSDTQETTCHVFTYKGQKFKIFDTPGVCDTAGIGKDELNFKNIMWSIGNYSHLNGILILMKPNSARLTIAFKYCINELLKHLHKDAAKNILFCFTNSSGTNYEEGDTIPALQRMLAEIKKEHKVTIELNDQTTYYVDNESFRYLCELKNNIQPSERAKNRATESWEMTMPVIRRMLSYVQTLSPHNVLKTVSLNEARRIIVTLAQPLPRITQIIQVNINLATTQQENIGKLDADSADLEKVLLTHQQRYVERQQLNHPRTVCTSPTCTTVEIDEFGESTTVYSKHCHPHCYLKNVREEARADPGLRRCSAMYRDDATGMIRCAGCGCAWDQHMHIYYELLEKTRLVESPAVKDMLKDNIDTKQIIEKAMAEANMRIQENQQEQDRINEIAARFGTYLKRNGIMSHNKYIEDYMQMHIQNAQHEAQYTNDNSKIESLENALKCYLEQRQIIERYLDTGKGTIHPSDIQKYLHELFNLKLNGAEIKKLFDAEEKSRKERAICAENQFVSQHKPRASRNHNFKPHRNDANGNYRNNQQYGSGRFGFSGSRSGGNNFMNGSQSYSDANSSSHQPSSSNSNSYGAANFLRSATSKIGGFFIKGSQKDD